MAVRSWGLLAFLCQRNLSAFSSTNRVVGRLGLQCSCSSKRSYAGESSGGEDNNVDGDNAGAADRHNGPNSRIEQALTEIRIQSAAPDWLPFFPGGSFWIHPDQIAAKKPEKPSGPLVYPTTDREVLAMVIPTGWPTSTATDDERRDDTPCSPVPMLSVPVVIDYLGIPWKTGLTDSIWKPQIRGNGISLELATLSKPHYIIRLSEIYFRRSR